MVEMIHCMYLVVYNNNGHNGGKALVHGQPTVKPAVVPIDSGISESNAGCCYDMVRTYCWNTAAVQYTVLELH